MADNLRNQNMMVHSTNGVVDTTSNINNDDNQNNNINSSNNNGNIIDGAMNAVGIIVSSASSSSSSVSSILPSSSSSSSSSAAAVHALADSVMIPFCASDLDALRALTSNSLNNGVTSNSSSLNVCINTGNIIVNARGSDMNQLTLEGASSVMNGLSSSNIVTNIPGHGVSSDLLHSNEITSNTGIDQRRVNLINNSEHFHGASGDYNNGNNASSSNNDNPNRNNNVSSNSNRALNKNIGINNNGMLPHQNPVSINGVLSNVNMDESGIISSNSFIPQQMNADLNQGAGILDRVGSRLNLRNQGLVDNTSNRNAKSLHGNRSLSSSGATGSNTRRFAIGGSSGVGCMDGSRMIAVTATANIHHHASGSSSISSNSNRLAMASRTPQVHGVSSSANTSRENSTTIEVHAGPSHRQNHQQASSVWIQPDQTQYPSTSQSELTLGGPQGSSSSAIDSQQGLVSISMGDPQLQQVVNMASANSFQGQGQFQDLFQIPVQQGERSETFQAAAHSTFDQPGPSGVQYRDLGGDSEATPSYPSMHHQIVAENMVESLNSAPTVDSSTLHQSFNLVFDTETRKLCVQPVIAPSDSTVSQSTLSLEGSEATPNPALLPMASQGYTMVQVNSMPPAFSSQGGAPGEVSTSSMGVVLGVEDRASSSGVGSLDNGLSSSQNIVVLQKLEDSSLDDATECDTTQEDIEFQQPQTPPHYSMPGTSNSIDDEVSSLDSSTPGTSSGLTHRVMGQHLVRGHGSSSPGDVMDATLDSSGLTVVSMDTGQSVITMEARRAPSPSSASSSMLQQHQQQQAASQMQSDILPSTSGMQASDAVAGPSRVYHMTSDLHQDENLPQSSGLGMHIRKSRRLELQEQEPRASQRKKEGSYRTQAYSIYQIWCDECMLSYDTECPHHRVSPMVDKVVLTRAWASCPAQVQICRLMDPSVEPGESRMGVFAKRQIGKLTQFGPFVGVLVDTFDSIHSSFFPLMLELEEGIKKYYDTQDENSCNWMKFIRPAKTFAEQNLVAFQHRDNIYFTVTKVIEAKQELKVWYAAHYAERLGLRPLELTEEDMQTLDEEDARFPCFECSRRFKSSAALQKHLEMVHENEDLLDLNVTGSVDNLVDDDDDDDEDFRAPIKGVIVEEGGEGFEGGGEGKRKGVMINGRLIQGKGKSRGRDSYQWKKKSTNLYRHKTLKKYKKRAQSSEKTLQSLRSSMYTRQGKDNGGNEWVCTYCGLTFDKRSLLNLHTLTHAAEDLVAGESKMEMNEDASEFGQGETNHDGTISLGTIMACPKCSVVFTDQRELMNHVATHAQKLKREKPFDCQSCAKSFTSKEKLLKHSIVHGKDEDKPLECSVCQKRLVNNSALACHMKTHSQCKYYDCPVCDQDFDTALALKEHAQKLHIDLNGNYPCTQCVKVFDDFQMLKRHMKAFHSSKVFECQHCSKEFPRVDKLKLHMLKHTTHREFMCELCGRQFKRKDKMKEHTKRMHSQDKLKQQTMKEKGAQSIKKFVPKVMPTEYHRFIYKCHACLLGFKRRGMLVNHLAKRHPEMKPEHVPELNLPILKTQKDFYCQYCDKIYKSSSKRKAHILKIHPGSLVPPSGRKKLPIAEDSVSNSTSLLAGNQVLTLNSFSHTVGSITTMPHGCKFCHKQYASKSKLLQHQRKKHAELVEPVASKKRSKPFKSEYLQITVGDPTVGGLINEHYETVPMVTVVTQPAPGDQLAGPADLLTQAMTEIQNYGNEFAAMNPRLNNNATMVQIQPSPLGQTIDINQLNQALQSMTSSQAGVTTVLAPPHASIITQQPQHHQVQLVANSAANPQSSQLQQGVQLVAAGGQGGQGINLNSVGNQFITTRAWPTSFTSQFS